ncbi:MAG: OmpA family protein [Myxococcales bacterium]|nr:OmpA family protein [Myxococcales bacterium]
MNETPTGVGGKPKVICVMLDEQAESYASELEELKGVELLMQDSPEEALDQVAELQPHLVLAGMDLGSMEGIEFLALLMRRYPATTVKVVVLPEKDDPFPAMLQYRDAATGRSVTEETSWPAVRELCASLSGHRTSSLGVAAVVPPPQQMAPIDAASPMQLADALEQSLRPAGSSAAAMAATIVDIPKTPSIPSAPEPTAVESIPAPLAPGVSLLGKVPPNKNLLIGGAVGVVVLLLLLISLLGGDDEGDGDAAADPPAAGAGAAQPDVVEAMEQAATAEGEAAAEGATRELEKDDEAEKANAPEPPSAPSQAPSPAKAEAVKPASSGAPASGQGFAKRITLPLAFDRGRAQFKVRDADKLSSLVQAAQAALKADPAARLEVGGHTSKDGAASKNRLLGSRRANAVRQALIARGLPADRLVAQSYGEHVELSAAEHKLSASHLRRVTLQVIY